MLNNPTKMDRPNANTNADNHNHSQQENEYTPGIGWKKTPEHLISTEHDETRQMEIMHGYWILDISVDEKWLRIMATNGPS